MMSLLSYYDFRTVPKLSNGYLTLLRYYDSQGTTTLLRYNYPLNTVKNGLEKCILIGGSIPGDITAKVFEVYFKDKVILMQFD